MKEEVVKLRDLRSLIQEVLDERCERVAVKRSTAARMLDCSETTIRKLCAEGKLEVVEVASDPRITVESIKRFAKQSA